MPFAAFPVDQLPFGSTPGCDAEVVRYDTRATIKRATPVQTLVDMVLYSSDTLEDPMRMGALLSKWKRRETVVFHIRDEAQSLAKKEENKVVDCHKRDVPPPPELAYLRAYFGNLYGLNCCVTATHFPVPSSHTGSTGPPCRHVMQSFAAVRSSK